MVQTQCTLIQGHLCRLNKQFGKQYLEWKCYIVDYLSRNDDIQIIHHISMFWVKGVMQINNCHVSA